MANKFDRAAFGRRLAAIRMERGVSQTALAEASGVSVNAIARYETGSATPGADKVCRLADVLDCSVDVLIGRVSITEKEA